MLLTNKKFILISIIVLILIVSGIFLNRQKEMLSPVDIEVNKDQVVVLPEEKNIEFQNQEQSSETSTEDKKTYSIEEVAKHNLKENCWAVIRGKVYDLTQWIDKHPAGPDKILNICGKDGTEIFEKVHGGKEKPENILKRFEIGILE